MDGYFNNGNNFNYSGYSQPNSNLGTFNSCPGGNCPRLTDHAKNKAQEQGPGMGSQHSCPGGQCLNGHCSIGRSGSNRNWQNYGR